MEPCVLWFRKVWISDHHPTARIQLPPVNVLPMKLSMTVGTTTVVAVRTAAGVCRMARRVAGRPVTHGAVIETNLEKIDVVFKKICIMDKV
ncbi:hypothetical protein ACFLXB_08205, partial [Chloroflexota bacterium]